MGASRRSCLDKILENNLQTKSGIALALSGGGSRAIAFHYGVLETLHELRIDSKIDVVSGISGGAIVAALWTLYSKDWHLFSEKIQWIINNGFEKLLLKRLFNLNRIFRFCRLGIDADHFAEVLDEHLFDGIKLTGIPAHPCLILNAAELRQGVNFKFSKNVCGSYKDGGCIFPDLRLSQAVAYSAAYPLFFSVKKMMMPNGKGAFLTDGGAYDCIGANSLMPDKDTKSILTQNSETVIISDASFPHQTDPKALTVSIINGLYASYITSSNKNRSLIYNKLFLLNKTKDIPFLGVIKMDSEHPDLTEGWDKEELSLINRYKTDFRPIEKKAFSIIRNRGKKIATFIVKQYLKHLL